MQSNCLNAFGRVGTNSSRSSMINAKRFTARDNEGRYRATNDATGEVVEGSYRHVIQELSLWAEHTFTVCGSAVILERVE